MRRLPGGSEPETAFITAITADGRVVPGQDPRASVLLLGYRSGER